MLFWFSELYWFQKEAIEVDYLKYGWRFPSIDWHNMWGKSTVDTTSPLLTIKCICNYTCTRCTFSIIKEKYIEKINPSECGRALKYIIFEGKNWGSIIPKRDVENWQLLQRPNPNILPTILPKAPIILSSVASPICQEGQRERTFPIFAFSFRFFLFSLWFFFFSSRCFLFFLDFSLFFLIFGKFFAVRGGTLPPLHPQWLCHWLYYAEGTTI